MLGVRLLSALILGPLIIALLYVGDWPFLLLVLLASGVAYHEFCAMLRHAGQRPFVHLGLAFALLIVATSYFRRDDLPPAAMTAALLVVAGWALIQKRAASDLMIDAALTLAGILYVGWLLHYGLLLRLTDDGLAWSIVALVGTWAADTGAYLTGRSLGRRKVAPLISPGKTWEGVFGGVALTLVAAVALGAPLLGLALWQALLLGVLIAWTAVVGDLVESLLKRAAGVKDSGSLIPGHGGLLDRLDSLLFVLPVVYFFALWLAR
jgi:phosphatidate cytidylyltransferase